MPIKLKRGVLKTLQVMMIVVACTVWSIFGLVVIQEFLAPPGKKYSPEVYSNEPAIFNVGKHAFKVPQDYSFLTLDDYRDLDGSYNPQLIFNFHYPDFVAPYGDPRYFGHGPNTYDADDLIETYVQDFEQDFDVGMNELNTIHAGTTTDTLKPGPYQLFEVHQKGEEDWSRNARYIGVTNGIAIDITCGDPSILQKDGTRNDSCVVFFQYRDLSIEQTYPTKYLKYWKDIYKKTYDFLATHEVK
jgi:hypothetical protein